LVFVRALEYEECEKFYVRAFTSLPNWFTRQCTQEENALPEENDKQTIDMKTKENDLGQDYDRKAFKFYLALLKACLKDVTRPCPSLVDVIVNLSDAVVSNRPCFSLFADDGSQSSAQYSGGKGS
jgi:hypothetical protein